MPAPASNKARRACPPSTTIRTPSMVSEVSAMAVASTTRRLPSVDGNKAARCLAKGNEPWMGRTSKAAPSSRPCTRSISRTPGRKTNVSPASSVIARLMHPATAVSKASRGPLGFFQGASSQRVSTGYARPSERIVGALPMTVPTASPSSVADMTNSRKSSRSADCASRQSAKPKSAWIERS